MNNIYDEELENIIGGLKSFVTGSSANSAIVARALAEIGKPYKYGAVGPDSYDSSGFVSYCITGVHVRIGTPSTFLGWPRVSNPQPGDICASNSSCGIYISPGTMITAGTFGSGVSYSPIEGGMVIVRNCS